MLTGLDPRQATTSPANCAGGAPRENHKKKREDIHMTGSNIISSGTRDARKTKALRGVAIALLLCLASMFLQNLIQTDFGHVEIQQIQTVGGLGK